VVVYFYQRLAESRRTKEHKGRSIMASLPPLAGAGPMAIPGYWGNLL
jgi:hypothetical protein